MKDWIDIKDMQPEKERYYSVKYEDGTTDEKPFRIRPKQNIKGFMTMNKVTHWK